MFHLLNLIQFLQQLNHCYHHKIHQLQKYDVRFLHKYLVLSIIEGSHNKSSCSASILSISFSHSKRVVPDVLDFPLIVIKGVVHQKFLHEQFYFYQNLSSLVLLLFSDKIPF